MHGVSSVVANGANLKLVVIMQGRFKRLLVGTNESLAQSLLLYVTQHGLFDEIRTDPGSDYTYEVMELLLKLLGIKHSFTIVNNPKGSNVELTSYAPSACYCHGLASGKQVVV